MNQFLSKPLSDAPLGKPTAYGVAYDPNCLFAVERHLKRSEIGITHAYLPFHGEDIWNGYELSWLNLRGKPVVAIGTFYFPCQSPYLIESKSFKLYLNGLNQARFESVQAVQDLLEKDLSKACGGSVRVDLQSLQEAFGDAIYLDALDVECSVYLPCKDFLTTQPEEGCLQESVYSHLLKSNCLVTGQPDWGSVCIQYLGTKINHAGLLRYIVSFRNHNGFHEHCVEEIYQAIAERCCPKLLTVYARYTRRGGLDINPYRTNDPAFKAANCRLVRQ